MRGIRLEYVLGFIAVCGFIVWGVWAVPPPERIPESVRLYQALGDRLPQSQFNLNLCRLLAKASRTPRFYATPAEREPGPACDLSRVTLAYGGWCAAGMVDPDPHFSQSLMPQIEVVDYSDGRVIYVNNYLKSHVPRTLEGEQAAIAFLRRLPDILDVRGEGLPVFPPDWERYIPLRKGTR